eukprot:1855829-Rhodomonas_salina.1
MAYAMSGTEIAYGLRGVQYGCAMRCTELAYGAMRSADTRDVAVEWLAKMPPSEVRDRLILSRPGT